MVSRLWHIIALYGAFLPVAPAAELTVGEFIKQVHSSSLAIRASQTNHEAATLKTAEASLLYSPSLTATGNFADDRRAQLYSFYGTETISGSMGLNVSQLTSWGMTAKLGYTYTATNIIGSIGQSYVGAPALELSQSLWANGFGRSTRATFDSTEATYLASAFTESYKTKSLSIAAELAYWRLAFARRIVKIQEEVLARAISLYEWSAKRTKMNLADRSDLLQTQAALQLRKLELKNAKDEERAASIAFNSQRNIEGPQVSEQLSIPTTDSIQNLMPIPRETLTGPREDVLAAQQGERATVAGAIVAVEKNKPTLDLTASLAANGLDLTSPAPAISQSLGFTKPYFAVGLKFTMPLATGTSSDVRKGYEVAKAAAGFTSQKAFFDSEQEWRDLSGSFAEAKERLKLAQDLAELQRQKLEHERDRLRRGRSTTYQIILFEQDSSQSELSLVRATSDIIRIYSQMKSFAKGPLP